MDADNSNKGSINFRHSFNNYLDDINHRSELKQIYINRLKQLLQ